MNTFAIRLNTFAIRLRKVDLPDELDDGFDYLVVQISIDGKPLTDYTYYATDYIALVNSIDRSGEFEIITCWCGSAICAGLRQGVCVSHKENRVIWMINEPPPYRRLMFDAEEYAAAIRALPRQANELIRWLKNYGERPIEIVPGYNERYFDMNPKPYGQ